MNHWSWGTWALLSKEHNERKVAFTPIYTYKCTTGLGLLLVQQKKVGNCGNRVHITRGEFLFIFVCWVSPIRIGIHLDISRVPNTYCTHIHLYRCFCLLVVRVGKYAFMLSNIKQIFFVPTYLSRHYYNYSCSYNNQRLNCTMLSSSAKWECLHSTPTSSISVDSDNSSKAEKGKHGAISLVSLEGLAAREDPPPPHGGGKVAQRTGAPGGSGRHLAAMVPHHGGGRRKGHHRLLGHHVGGKWALKSVLIRD